MELNDIVHGLVVFDWDEGNIDKNWEKHKVTISECEDIFFNQPLIAIDYQHSQTEQRYFAYGITDKGKRLFISFTVRQNKIRVISARNMNKKERRFYHEKIKDNT